MVCCWQQVDDLFYSTQNSSYQNWSPITLLFDWDIEYRPVGLSVDFLCSYIMLVAEVQEIWHHWGPVKHSLFSSSLCDWQGKPGNRGEPGIPGEPVSCILRLSLSCQSTRHSFVTADWHIGSFCSLTGWEGATRRDRIPRARGTPRCSCKDANWILLLFLLHSWLDVARSLSSNV